VGRREHAVSAKKPHRGRFNAVGRGKQANKQFLQSNLIGGDLMLEVGESKQIQ
jgi:hypothetical protein